jgi:hypothetical protein
MRTVHPILIYGSWGSGKTALMAEICRFLGIKARLYTCEHYNSIQDAIDEGIVEVWKINTRAHPFETFRAAADKFWPADPMDPTSPLLPPTENGAEQFGAFMYEGLGTGCQYLISNHAEGGLLDRAGKGDIIGPVQEHIQFMDGETGIGGLCWAHYNVSQREMVGLVQRSQKFPGLIFWTSHEDDGKERKGQAPVMGPEVIGSAVTAGIGREFADVWHIAKFPTAIAQPDGTSTVIEQRRLYVKDHILSEGGLTYKSKNSAGLRRQAEIPDYFVMSDEEGLPRLDLPERVFSAIKANVSPSGTSK